MFSIDSVIMDVAPPAAWARSGYRLVRILLYDDVRFLIYSTAGAVMIGAIVARVVTSRAGRAHAVAAVEGQERRRP